LNALDEEEFDLVLMDINMPRMSGVEAVKMYRFAHTEEPHLPIVALTADATTEAQALCLEAGMDGYVTKPVDAPTLLRTIAELLPARKSLQAVPLPAPTDQTVTSLASHPRFSSGEDSEDYDEPIIDRNALAELRALDPDPSFVVEVIDDYLRDATTVTREMDRALERQDIAALRDHAHSLKSSSANVGARRLANVLQGFRTMTERDLRDDGRERIARVQREFARVSSELNAQVATERVRRRVGAPD
ncbi:MAG: response regulator, partial [Alphaproteobacteria bacterium]